MLASLVVAVGLSFGSAPPRAIGDTSLGPQHADRRSGAQPAARQPAAAEVASAREFAKFPFVFSKGGRLRNLACAHFGQKRLDSRFCTFKLKFRPRDKIDFCILFEWKFASKH